MLSDPNSRHFISKLPSSSPTLFGREKELALLDDAWDNRTCRLLQFIAWGGVGKTGLVTSWLLNRMADGSFNDVAVYAWSFYSQGASDQRQGSADLFLVDILKWFGEDKTKLPQSPHDRGRLLADHLRRQRTLLILDGLEPLQYPPGELEGQLKDQGLRVLLREIAANQPGLCIITSRIAVKDVEQFLGKAARLVPLEQLSDPAGAELLTSLGVKGLPKELEAASAEFKGHALALRLLGNYLAAVHKGDVRRRDKVAKHLELSEKDGRHARRVMDAYVHWLGADSPEMALLLLVGLFDRPAPIGALEALFGNSHFTKLVWRQLIFKFDWRLVWGIWKFRKLIRALRKCNSDKLKLAVKHLADLSLIVAHETNDNVSNQYFPGLEGITSLDAHPLVREHFGARFEKDHPDAWRQCHAALYSYYKALPEKEFPDTLEEMEPLFAAVAHGCRAGMYNEAEYEVYWKRILRENDYINSKLGAFGSDLTVLAWFFERPWDKPAESLTEHRKAVVLSWAGFSLRALGRLGEAAQPMKASTEMAAKNGDWENAASGASTLSELYLSLGDLRQAVAFGQQSVEYADKSGDGFEKESDRTTYADALHQSGLLEEAARHFAEAEAMQRERQPGYEYLYSLGGFQYCDLLLSKAQPPAPLKGEPKPVPPSEPSDVEVPTTLHQWVPPLGAAEACEANGGAGAERQGAIEEVIRRAKQTLEWAKENRASLLSHALDHLTLGKAYHLSSTHTPTDDNKAAASHHLDTAVAGLRKAGAQEFISLGLLARAAWHRHCGAYAAAATDLAEVEEIASAGGMKLYLCDYHLEMARLQQAKGEVAAAKVHTEQAARMVEEMGYHRRDGEVAALRAALSNP